MTPSLPLRLALDQKLISRENTVLDYGCGRGFDVSHLKRMSIACRGWDPYFEPKTELRPSDVVLLFYVLNVIECPFERKETLQKAFSLAKKHLLVAARVESQPSWQRYGDGHISRRSTFQKFYRPAELEKYVRNTVPASVQRIGPGVVLAERIEMKAQYQFSEVHSVLKKLDFGKKIAGDFYFHRSAVKFLPMVAKDLIATAESLARGVQYNLIKFSLLRGKLTLLEYNDFETVPNPELRVAHTVNLTSNSVQTRRYKAHNPPILHRKELFVHPSHAQFTRFAKETEAQRAAGLFDSPPPGFKKQWDNLVAGSPFTPLN